MENFSPMSCFLDILMTNPWHGGYMDDGHLKLNGNNIPLKIILSTESFSKTENEWLIAFLKDKYFISFHIDKQNRIILYDQKQIHFFLSVVEPYMHSSMYRKLIPSYNIKNITLQKRSTIYLPTTIKIDSPTKEINTALPGLESIIRHFKNQSFYKKYYRSSIVSENIPIKGYQIIINNENLSNLIFLKEVTGFIFSALTLLCFENRSVVK